MIDLMPEAFLYWCHQQQPHQRRPVIRWLPLEIELVASWLNYSEGVALVGLQRLQCIPSTGLRWFIRFAFQYFCAIKWTCLLLPSGESFRCGAVKVVRISRSCSFDYFFWRLFVSLEGQQSVGLEVRFLSINRIQTDRERDLALHLLLSISVLAQGNPSRRNSILLLWLVLRIIARARFLTTDCPHSGRRLRRWTTIFDYILAFSFCPFSKAWARQSSHTHWMSWTPEWQYREEFSVIDK